MSIKLTLEAANDLLKKIGVEVVVVAEAEQADANPDLENIAKGVFNEMETKIKHDVEYEIREEVKSQEAGKHLGSLRTLFKREFGIDEKEMKDLPQQEIVKLAKSKLALDKSKAAGDKAETDNELLQRYNDLLTEKQQLEDSIESKLSEKDNEWMQKFQSKDIQERVLDLVNKTPRSGGDPMKQARAIMRELESEYTVKINENKEIELFDKKDSGKKVFDGKNLITDKYFVEKNLRDMGVIATDTRHVKPADVLEGKQTSVKSGVAQLAPTDAMEFIKESMQQA